MGKFGARRAQLFERHRPDRPLRPRASRGSPRTSSRRRVFVRLTKRLVHILNERTADGYVFRTDLRLRPDPGATNIAMSTEAALQYYESLGQNWERAALIKARPVAGDIAAGEAFLAELTPYIWRKYLDYAAIADIHSIKRQIHDHRGHEEIAVAGHNIKLGRGGIREIEFFVQTQQLIAGGRNPELRGRRTLDMLAALADGRLDRRGDARRPDRGLSSRSARSSIACRWSTTSRPTRCPRTRRAWPSSRAWPAIADVAAFSRSADSRRSPRSATATRRCSRRRRADLGIRQPRLHRRHRRPGDARDARAPRLSRSRPRSPARSAPGISAATRRCARPTARERLTEITPALLEALAGDRQCRRRLRRLRPLPRPAAGRRPALLAAQLQSRPARPARHDPGRRRRASPRPSSSAPMSSMR